MFGNRFAVTLDGYLVAHFGSRMQADTAANRLRDALTASLSVTHLIDVVSDHEMKIEAASCR